MPLMLPQDFVPECIIELENSVTLSLQEITEQSSLEQIYRSFVNVLISKGNFSLI